MRKLFNHTAFKPFNALKQTVYALLSLMVLALIIHGLQQQAFGVNWQSSDSMPKGWYLTSPPHELKKNDIILFHPPIKTQVLISHRHWGTTSTLLMKPIIAVPGDNVCYAKHQMIVNHTLQITRLPKDRQGRPLPQRHGCHRLNDGEYVVASQYTPFSFDSRYFGPITASSIVSKAHPILITQRTPRNG